MAPAAAAPGRRGPRMPNRSSASARSATPAHGQDARHRTLRAPRRGTSRAGATSPSPLPGRAATDDQRERSPPSPSSRAAPRPARPRRPAGQSPRSAAAAEYCPVSPLPADAHFASSRARVRDRGEPRPRRSVTGSARDQVGQGAATRTGCRLHRRTGPSSGRPASSARSRTYRTRPRGPGPASRLTSPHGRRVDRTRAAPATRSSHRGYRSSSGTRSAGQCPRTVAA